MRKSELTQRLLITFTGELQEHVSSLERDLLALEKSQDPGRRAEIFATLFRAAHSLKGAAGSVGVGPIETACHALEGIFSTARSSHRMLDPALFQLLFATTDMLREAGRRLAQEGDVSGAALAGLLPRLMSAGNAVAPPETAPPPGELRPPAGDALAITGSEADRSREAFVRVPARKLDALLAQSGELLVARSRSAAGAAELLHLTELVRQSLAEWTSFENAVTGLVSGEGGDQQVPGALRRSNPAAHGLRRKLTRSAQALRTVEKTLHRLTAALNEDRRAVDGAASSLDAEIRRARMQSFAQCCDGLERMVRDLCKGSGKSVKLNIEGAEIEVDRSILEGLKDPLRHLVRNAIDHGIEPADLRRAAGKPETGRITIGAALRGNHIEVVVADDGRGLDLDRIREKIGRKDVQDDQELVGEIFSAGFSTSRTITNLSGRGIGLDVVRTAVEAMRGSVSVSHQRGSGACFTLSLPLTLTTIRAVLAVCGGQTFAIDSTSVRRLVRLREGDIRSIEGKPVVILEDGPVPVLELGQWLGLPSAPEPERGTVTAVIIVTGGKRVAVMVDELLAEEELVVRTLGPRLSALKLYSGGTVLPDGGLALILNVAALIDAAGRTRASRVAATPHGTRDRAAKKRLLVVDDSVTTRTLVKAILEGAGYDVRAAADGAEAWQLLQTHGADLVVTDVEMPRMDGFELTQSIRGSKRFGNLPVILVTARENDQDRERGLHAGANSYLLKSSFDQRQLLEAIGHVL